MKLKQRRLNFKGLWVTSFNKIINITKFDEIENKWEGFVVNKETGDRYEKCVFDIFGYPCELYKELGFLVKHQRSTEEKGWPTIQELS